MKDLTDPCPVKTAADLQTAKYQATESKKMYWTTETEDAPRIGFNYISALTKFLCFKRTVSPDSEFTCSRIYEIRIINEE